MYHYAVVARKFVKASRIGLTLIIGATLLIGAVKDFKVVVINFFAGTDIGKELQD